MHHETFRACSVALITVLALCGCSELHGPLGLGDVSAARSPAYAANKVLFLDSPVLTPPATNQPLPAASDELRFANLLEAHQIAANLAMNRNGARRSVLNRQPVSILINRAYVPTSLQRCAKRLSDVFGRRRDIAVLLDTATADDKQESIAVWYQQNVFLDDKAVAGTEQTEGAPQSDGTLNFQDLLVFSEDSWDSNYPPYFRMRLIDVSVERNTAVGQLLDEVEGSTRAITGLLGVPDSPLIGIAKLAAKQVLANEQNIPILDFTFQLYGASTLDEAGGVPLGVLQTGGVIVTAPPCGRDNSYWNDKLKFDYTLNRVEGLDSSVREQPYILATILTSDLAVPTIVRTRSEAIMQRLTDPKITGEEILEAHYDARRLTSALGVLATRETFRRRPSKGAFARLVGEASAAAENLDEPETEFYLDTFYRVTGVNFAELADYDAWVTNCSDFARFNGETGRYERDMSLEGENGELCWQ